MRTIPTDALVPGMVVAKDIYDRSGLLIVGEGTKLTSDNISKLSGWGILEVSIEEPAASVIDQQEEVLAAQISVAHDRVIGFAENVLSTTDEIDPVLLMGMVGDLDSQIELNTNVLLNLSHMKTYDNYLFAHSANVCILSLIIGKSLKLSGNELDELGLAALLHDYGMIKLERSVYDHDRRLAPEEWEKVKAHPRYGYEMLLNSGNFSENITSGILDHHERCDGSGYPAGKTGDDIHFFGRIIAVADVYDACISFRKYRARIAPHEALRSLLGNSHLFDLNILKTFLTIMAIYPIGSIVRLNSGEIAKVIGINQGQPFRPEIRILFDRNQKRLEIPIRISLMEPDYAHTYIMEIFDGAKLEEIYALLNKKNA